MRTTRFAVYLLAALGAAAGAARAQQGAGKTDPDWPCHQIKTPVFSLAAIWNGPPVDTELQAWRSDPELADLVAAMSQRRVPVEEALTKIADFAKRGGEAAKPRLLQAFGAAFAELTRQRSDIIAGLDRVGRKQHELVARIRAENEAAQDFINATTPGQEIDPSKPGAELYQKLQWDMRVFEDRRRSVSYVCEAPSQIEQRIGALARAVQAAQ